MLLWEEYKEKHPDGVMYTQFCKRYRNSKRATSLMEAAKGSIGIKEAACEWPRKNLVIIIQQYDMYIH